MRILKLQMNMTIDGFVGGINGEQNWLERNQDKEFIKFYQNDIIDSSDTLLLGRKMTSIFINHWESQYENPNALFARKLVDIPKIVFSKTITTIVGKNTRVENGDIVTVVNQLKSEAGKDILVYGGANFVSALIQNNLIDEFYFIIHPTAIGNGLKIFTDTTSLKLTGSKSFNCGVVVNQYKVDIVVD